MDYKSYTEFVIENFGKFVLTFRVYQMYCEYCLKNDYYYYGRNNEYSQNYYYNKLQKDLALNRYV